MVILNYIVHMLKVLVVLPFIFSFLLLFYLIHPYLHISPLFLPIQMLSFLQSYLLLFWYHQLLLFLLQLLQLPFQLPFLLLLLLFLSFLQLLLLFSQQLQQVQLHLLQLSWVPPYCLLKKIQFNNLPLNPSTIVDTNQFHPYLESIHPYCTFLAALYH